MAATTQKPPGKVIMNADRSRNPVVHLVGSLPLPDSQSVFRTVSDAVGMHLLRLPDGETGVRKTWIKYLQDVLAEKPAIEVAHDLPPFKFTQWDGKVIREIPRLRLRAGARPDPQSFKTGYADMAIDSFGVFDALQKAGTIPAGIRFQISLPSPLAPIYNNMIPADRRGLIPTLTRTFLGEVETIARHLPADRIAIQWDVCQEVLAWEGYFDRGPADFRTETIDVLTEIGDAIPGAMELGYHLCYGSPADEHMVQPKDSTIMVEMTNAISAGVSRPIQFFLLPVPKPRTDDEFFKPLERLALKPETELYLGLIHHDDPAGDDVRLAAARRHTRVDGVGTECGWARGDASRVGSLLRSHARLAERA
jgi:hypothetical protein